MRAKADDWAKKLIDLGFRNTLLYFRNTKTASLDLTAAEPAALAALASGGKVRLGQLLTEPKAHKDACTQARSISKRILLFREEQGVEVGKLAFGMVTTPAPVVSGASKVSKLRAPLVLRSVLIKARTASESDFTLELGDDAEVNPVLLHALDQQYGVDIDIDGFSAEADTLLGDSADYQQQVTAVFDKLVERARGQRVELGIENAVVVGLFNYEKLPMVNDLRAAGELLAGHELIAAMAGYQPAADELHAAAAAFSAPRVDEISPPHEYLVQDADSSQQRAVTTALAGHHVLIEGPPGTGKSQTIANIIAGAAAEGKTVLFVAEKRAALEAVMSRLEQVGLDNLVLDLHQQKLNRGQIAQQLAESLDQAAKEPPVDPGTVHERLADRRQRLVDYEAGLHSRRAPWGVTAREVQAKLLDIGSMYKSKHVFRGPQLYNLDHGVVQALSRDLRSFVDSGGARVLRGDSPWSNSPIRTEDDVRKALYELDELADKTLNRSRDGIQRLLAPTGLAQPHDVNGWQDVLAFLDQVEASVQAFGQDIFGGYLDRMFYATADRKTRARYPNQLPWSERRKLVKQLRAMSVHGVTKKAALHNALVTVVRQRDRWRELSGGRTEPAHVMGLEEAMRDYKELRRQLAAVALSAKLQNLESRPAQHVAEQLEELRADKNTLWQLPKLTQFRERFHALGLTELLNEAAARKANADQTWLMFERAWLASLDDEFKLRFPVLREFVGDQQTRFVAEFQAADREHRQLAARRIRRRVARVLLEAKNDYPQQAIVVREQANRKRGHKPTRKLVDEASEVLLALRPCWAMSPLVVSKMLPAAKLFDLVVFDEASQIRPHDAITSIMRGSKLVVAGDDKQLPPSSFFDKMLAGEDADDETDGGLDDYESILTSLRPKIPNTQMLRWHYRSADERLISFSNKEIYGNKLVTFPGMAQESPVTAEFVDGVVSPGQSGSSPAEVERVVQIVLQHAQLRPHESLGVIALGTKHQARIEQRLREVRRDRTDLDEFFSEEASSGKRFFIKNLESVQGDERDVIVLSVGVAKGVNGRINRTSFGPLNYEGSARRVNVAVTRAKRRMTIVSSFRAADLEPAEQVNGTELLRRYLDFAERRGEIDQVGRLAGGELNGFERAIHDALVSKGIMVFPQWGFSDYYIDFALAHRDDPGRMVLAVEADGDTYHRSESARDRDRLRQAHLENLGWRFHRLWSSAWFADPEGETEKIVRAWEDAIKYADSDPAPTEPEFVGEIVEPPALRRLSRPNVPVGLRTQEYSDRQLIELCRWLISDGLLLDRQERVDQARAELGFKKRGKIIDERLGRAVDIAQGLADKEED
ncbi:AAA domain-containing protein [Amycolatopsis sp. cg5]|uniref:AAA domain-containing protein n=1 Tax=Amycolatopsis sp. cg5 TaxID=3238802 RepID=UPI003524AE23